MDNPKPSVIDVLGEFYDSFDFHARFVLDMESGYKEFQSRFDREVLTPDPRRNKLSIAIQGVNEVGANG